MPKLITDFFEKLPPSRTDIKPRQLSITDFFKTPDEQKRFQKRKLFNQLMLKRRKKREYMRAYRKKRDIINCLYEKYDYTCRKRKKELLFVANSDFSEFNVYKIMGTTFKELEDSMRTSIANAQVDGEGALSFISVKESYRRQGIGTEIIRFINERMPEKDFIIFGGQEHNSRYRLTEQGMNLIMSCLRKRIIQPRQFIGNEVPRSPSLHY